MPRKSHPIAYRKCMSTCRQRDTINKTLSFSFWNSTIVEVEINIAPKKSNYVQSCHRTFSCWFRLDLYTVKDNTAILKMSTIRVSL